MDIRQITIGGGVYQYDRPALELELQKRNLDPVAIGAVISEIGRGEMATLRRLGLDAFVTPTGDCSLPPPDRLDAGALFDAANRLDVFNFLEILYALHEASKELRQANREMRLAERDIAVSEAMASASKIRSAALINLVVGVVSGAVNIGMGLASVGSASKQLSSMKGPAADLKAAKTEVQQNKANQSLADSQVKLSQAKVEVAARQTAFDDKRSQLQGDIDKTKADIARLEGHLERMDPKSPLGQQKQAQIDQAKMQLVKQQAALDNHVNNGSPELREAQNKEARVEGEVKNQAAKAEKSNLDQKEALKKSIAGKEAEIAKMEKGGADSPAENAKLEQAKADLADMRAKLAECDKLSSLHRDPTSPDALKSAPERLAQAKTLGGPEGRVGKRFADAQSTLNTVTSKVHTNAARIQGWTMFAGGVTQIAQGAGQYAAAQEQADGAEHTARAQAAASKENENAEYYKTFNDMVQSVQNILKECLQQQNQANASIYRNM